MVNSPLIIINQIPVKTATSFLFFFSRYRKFDSKIYLKMSKHLGYLNQF